MHFTSKTFGTFSHSLGKRKKKLTFNNEKLFKVGWWLVDVFPVTEDVFSVTDFSLMASLTSLSSQYLVVMKCSSNFLSINGVFSPCDWSKKVSPKFKYYFNHFQLITKTEDMKFELH